MPKTGYRTCREIMSDLLARGYENKATMLEIHKSISRCAGVTPRTKRQYIVALKDLGFIEALGDGIFVLRHPGGSS